MVYLSKIDLSEYLETRSERYSYDSLKYDDPERPIPTTENEKAWWKSEVETGKLRIWKICDEENERCGIISAFSFAQDKNECEIGVNIFPKERYNKGYAKEAISALIDANIKAMGIKIVRAETNVENRYAVRLFESLGFKTKELRKEGQITWKIMDKRIA